MSEQASEQSIFLHAIGLPPAQRAAYLDEACRDNPAVRGEVEALLAAQDRLDKGLAPTVGPEPASVAPGIEPGSVLSGRYKLLEAIGEGGMGTVWMAQQTEPVRRLVALKVIKAGMDSKQVLARFEAERQALALMDHPNIARVLDAGTTAGGRPYFVMERVQGIPITRYCDEHRLTPRQRLELFIPLCQAIQHAHQKGIIHRDVKPSNVLVPSYDGKPVVKVIDFGIAKATGGQLTDRTLMTGFGAIVGTLEYMSPEQAELNALDVDTRSDIYSLGVVLYELLTGTTPLEKKRLREAAMLEVLRLIREEEPPRPSTRLSTTAELPAVAANRGMEPKKLSTLVRGELDWIVMKALDKDRNRRYETANGLAADLRRYLADEPVQACPPSAWYRFRKLARRNRVALTTAALVAAVLVAGTTVSTWLAILARQAETAERLAGEARDVALGEKDVALGEKDAALTQTKAARQALQINLADMYTTQGLLAGERGNSAQAALWFANAARLAGDDKERVQANRIRARAWGRLAPRPAAAVVHAAEWLEDMAIHTGGRHLLTHGFDAARGEGECQLWDLQREAAAAMPGAGQRVTAAAWDRVGERLAVGSAAGEVVVASFPGGAARARFAFAGRVHRLAFSPDGRYLGAAGGTVARVWDCRQGSFATPPLPHPQTIAALAFHPEGRLLATTCQDHLCRVFAVPGDTAAPLFDPVRHVNYSARGLGHKSLPPLFVDEGRTLLTSIGTTVERRDSRTGRVEGTLGNNSQLESAALSPDGSLLVLGGYEQGRVWNLRTGAMLGLPLAVRPTQSVLCAAFSPDGNLVAIGSGDHTVRLWSVLEGKPIGEPLLHAATVSGVAFCPDGRHLATCQRGGLIRLWRLPATAPAVGVPTGGISDVQASRDGRYLLPTGLSQYRHALQATRVYEAATGRPAGPWLSLGGPIIDAALSPDGRHAALAVSLASPQGKARGRLAFWRWREGELAAGPTDLPSAPRQLHYRPDGGLLAVVCAGGELLLIDPRTGKPARQWRAQRPHGVEYAYENNGRVRFSPDGERVVTYGNPENVARVWDATGALRLQLPHPGSCIDVRFSADSRLISTSSYDNTAYVWDAATGRQLAALRHPDWVYSAAFTRDRRRLLTACRDGMARLWDWRSGRLVCPAFEHEHEVMAAEFLVGERYVATAGYDRMLRVWETVTGKLLVPPVPLDGQGKFLVVTPDGSRLVLGGFMASVKIIDVKGLLWPGTLSPAELCRVGEVLSGQRIHQGGGVTNLSSGEWLRCWQSLSTGRQGYVAGGPEARLAWQRQAAEGHVSRGQALLSRGRTGEAIAALRHAAREQPRLVSAHWHLGRALSTQGLRPEAIASYRKALELAPEQATIHFDLGNVQEAAGKQDEAIASFKEAIRLDPDHAEAHCNLGYALLQQGRFAEALVARRRGHELGSQKPGWPFPSERWLQEAQRLVELDGKLPAILDGKTTPAGAKERIELAGLCCLKRLYRAATRFYEEAFAAQPGLADDLGADRYNAACAAALAAAGQGKDADKLDDKERARLRRQALGWLQEDLALRVKQLASGKPADRALVQAGMRHWQTDADLAGVRGRAALAKLPDTERQRWQKLWSDVADTLARAQAKGTPQKKSDAR